MNTEKKVPTTYLLNTNIDLILHTLKKLLEKSESEVISEIYKHTKDIMERDFPGIPVFIDFESEILELEYSIILVPIGGIHSFRDKSSHMVSSVTLLHKGEPIKTIMINPFSIFTEKWNAKKGKGGKYNYFEKIVSSQQLSIGGSKIALVNYSKRSMGHILDNFESKGSYVSKTDNIGYLAGLISCSKLDAFIVFSDDVFFKQEIANAFLLIKEAGGKITDFKGLEVKNIFEQVDGYIFSNGNNFFHNELVINVKEN